MRVLLYGKFGEYPNEIESLVKSFGLEVVKESPEVVISFGGDGTLLGAERDYPGIPKLPLRNSQICHLCSALPNDKLLELLAVGKLKTQEFMKLEVTAGDKIIIALNDVIIAHKFPNSAIRFTLEPSPYNLEPLIGDGVVISTPFGSTGYFYSVTKTTFETGIGIAFNNIHNGDQRLQLLSETETIKVILTRGPAVLAADNNPDLIDLREGEEVTISKSMRSAKILAPIPY